MQLTIEQALQQAVAAHREGKLNEAENIYRAILQSQPDHPDANHNLGVIAVSLNQIEAAVPLFTAALDVNPNVEQFWLSYVDALVKADRLKDAKQAIKKAKKKGFDAKKLGKLISQPKRGGESGAEVHFNLGNTLYLQGRLKEAEASFNQAIALKPDDAEAHNNLGTTLKGMGRLSEAEASYNQAIALKPDYAVAHSNLGLTLEGLGRLSEAEASYNQAIALKPDYAVAHNNLGNALQGMGRSSEAEASYNQAIAFKPDYADAHSNLGTTLLGMGKLKEAEASFNQAIALKPDYAVAHNNLATTLQAMGRLSEAEASYNRAIALKPDFAEAHSNLGNTLGELGRLSEAEDSINRAIGLKPDYAEAQQNLVNLLTIYTSHSQPLQPIARAHKQIGEFQLKEKTSGLISDNKIIDLINKTSNILINNNLDLHTSQSQIYRRNSVDLNCKRHMEIFDSFNIIPKFCFGCYKVQAEPRSLLELVKLSIIFDQIKLPGNNTRKCMVEVRPVVPGFYKGLIFCSSLSEAYQIAEKLEIIVEERIGPGVPLTVKRGCSEYPISFPDYKKINKSGAQPMEYNEEWAPIEEEYDAKQPKKSQTILSPTLSSLSLSDVLIIRNWIDYARGIGDSSVLLLDHYEVGSQELHEKAKTRLETYPWRQSAGAT